MTIETNRTIKTVRTKLRLSQEQMASDLGVSANYISLIENGKKKPGMNFLEKVADKYDIPLIVLAKSALVPAGKTQREREVRAKVIALISSLEKSFFTI